MRRVILQNYVTLDGFAADGEGVFDFAPRDREADRDLLLWYEGYHHGQIKPALKLSGLPVPDKVAGPLTWGVGRNRLEGGDDE